MPTEPKPYRIMVGDVVRGERTSKKAAQLLANAIRRDENVDARVFSPAGKDVSISDTFGVPVTDNMTGENIIVAALDKVLGDPKPKRISKPKAGASKVQAPDPGPKPGLDVDAAIAACPWPQTCDERVAFYMAARDAQKAWRKQGPSPMPDALASFNAWKDAGSPMPESAGDCGPEPGSKPKRERAARAPKQTKPDDGKTVESMTDAQLEAAVREIAAAIVPIRAFKVMPALRAAGYRRIDEERVLAVVKRIRAERGEADPRARGAKAAPKPKAGDDEVSRARAKRGSKPVTDIDLAVEKANSLQAKKAAKKAPRGEGCEAVAELMRP